MTPQAQQLQAKLLSPWMLRLFFVAKLPSLLFWGVKVQQLNSERAVSSIRFGYTNKNPFKSLYFAAQAGAAEFATGILALMAIEGRGKVSMLVTEIKAEFYKKATGVVFFECEQGKQVFEAVSKTLSTKQGTTITLTATGKNQLNEVVSVFHITWSFLAK